MKEPLFTVNKKGLLTSFQDLGRTGLQQFGVVTSGAIDVYALQIANLLVGNSRSEACIEVSMIGPELVVEASQAYISICGGNLSPTINGRPAIMWKTLSVKRGDVLSFGKPLCGVRSYIAVSGGYHIETILHSKSYYEKANLGERIEQGQIIYSNRSSHKRRKIVLPQALIPRYDREITLRVIGGPHKSTFTDKSFKEFFHTTYTLVQGDRMGARLKSNTPIKHVAGADIPSEAIPLGGIQVPSNGQPIILLADRQTTGGYTRIGTVISVDISKIAQLPVGGTIQFDACSIEDAHEAYIKREKYLKFMEMTTR
ncbi:biotin-dependent carboxyltransferase family protein [Bacillus timonensis]|nr:biotin-dependent carboxyltransferase family protein [Bacillus timonensis]